MMMGVGNHTTALLARATVNEGMWGGLTSFILSATHSADDVDLTLGRCEKSHQAVRAEGVV